MTHSFTLANTPTAARGLQLGLTLPALLDEACDRYPNDRALNQWRDRQWQPLSNLAFRQQSEAIALGLLALNLHRGDRVAFLMHSDLSFGLVDLGCLLAGLVSVPIDLTQTIENIVFILQQTEARVLILSNLDLYYQIAPHLVAVNHLQTLIVAEVPAGWPELCQQLNNHQKPIDETAHGPLSDACLHESHILDAAPLEPIHLVDPLPVGLQLRSLAEVQQWGERCRSEVQLQALRQAITPTDLATILYIASESKRPRGVMLSHQNISADILSAFSEFPNLGWGEQEVALLFLPLTHIFARAFFYGHLAYGHSIYFSDPNHVVRHLKMVNPTILITVPRLIEKVYERLVEQGNRLQPFERVVFTWALNVAQRYEVGTPPKLLADWQLKAVDRLVFARWRGIFGDRMKALICGGAALRADLTNLFTAAGVPLLQGYGLTETSAVLCYNRGAYNRAGTVGVPIPGAEIAIAPDQEILVRGPFVMQGYYRDQAATQRAIDVDGWLHTGDLGEISADGFLRITGVKKPLFKLSTGKYVSALPLEQELNQSELVDHAVVVGANHKFCALLIFPNLDWMQQELLALAVDPTTLMAFQHPCLITRYQALVDQANCHLPYWSTIRKFRLMPMKLTAAAGFLNSDGTLNRSHVLTTFAPEIAAFYHQEVSLSATLTDSDQLAICPVGEGLACPIYAQSLTHV